MKLAYAKLIVILLTIAGLLFSAGVAVFLFLPTFREIRRLSEDIVRAHSELEAQYVNRRNLLSSSVKVEEARKTLGTLSTQHLPPGRELDLITAVETIASRHGVEERLVLTPNTEKGAEELSLRFDITLNGPSLAVFRTIVDIERMPTLLLFDSGIVRPGEAEAGAPAFLSVNLRGSITAPPAGL